jgi:hypothetical protein
MYRVVCILLLLVGLGFAQVETRPSKGEPPSQNSEPPRSTTIRGPNDSSSKDEPIDLSRPQGDIREHPDVQDDDQTEMHTYDPHRADKAIEVGQFYYKVNRNYVAAISRFCEALDYKPNDAVATFWLAQSLDKAGDLKAALETYKEYLKILPEGPYALQTKKAIERLNSKAELPSKKLEKRLGCSAAASIGKPAGQPLPISPASGTNQ